MMAKRLGKLLTGESAGLPGITTKAVRREAVFLEENESGCRAVIGVYEEQKQSQETGGCMRPSPEGLTGLGCAALLRCAARPDLDEWVCIDELGYVEGGCAPFCDAVHTLLEKKRVLAVLRKQSTPFLNGLRERGDAFVCDLDAPFLPVGGIIMASGVGNRFGANKLLAELNGKALIDYVLEQTKEVFAHRVVVTRHAEIERLCRDRGISCVLHDFPGRNDTIRLGVEFLKKRFGEKHAPAGYMFCPSDQPFLSRQTLLTMLLTFSECGERDAVVRLAYGGRAGAPVLFGGVYERGLLALPQGKGGSWLLKDAPGKVRPVEAASPWELTDIDTPEDYKRCKEYAAAGGGCGKTGFMPTV